MTTKDKKKLVYIAAPLFNEIEWNRNTEIKTFIESLGFEVHLPQDKAGRFSDLSKKSDNITLLRDNIFNNDLKGVKTCDIILCLLDGRVPDEGTCVELGMAYMLGKICIGYKTDIRAMGKDGFDNIMVTESIKDNMAGTLDELKTILLKFQKDNK
jgi:nucleoside 2-deoxyribosyltransferase